MAEKLYKTLTFGYKRVDASPLESDSLFATVAEAEDYAMNNPTSYAGRQIAVVTEDKASLYIINPDKTLKEVGGEVPSPFVAQYRFTFENANADGVVAALIPAGYYMEDIIIGINESFDEDTTISVGTADEPAKFMSELDNAPYSNDNPAFYEIDCNFIPDEVTPVYLYIKPGATKGSGTLKITVA